MELKNPYDFTEVMYVILALHVKIYWQNTQPFSI